MDLEDDRPRTCHLAQAVGACGLAGPARFHRPGHREVESFDDTREVSSPVEVQWQGLQSPRVRRLSEAGRLIVIRRGEARMAMKRSAATPTSSSVQIA
ncbi:MAG: hypothetical protein GY921_07305 [Phycisphaeraceae bacterium]|nr:hypothetical protein [Phycisphaeraceae bacterium]